jgi:hypothetical protein
VDVDVLDSVSESEMFDPTGLSEKFNPAEKGGAASASTVEQPRKYIPVELASTAATARARGRVASPPGTTILPAQLAILLPAVPDTLILNLLEEAKQ